MLATKNLAQIVTVTSQEFSIRIVNKAINNIALLKAPSKNCMDLAARIGWATTSSIILPARSLLSSPSVELS